MSYAGFWKRFGALIIDGILLSVVNWIILAPILTALGISSGGGMFPFSGMSPEDVDIEALIGTLTAMVGIASAVKLVVDVLYHSFMESSKFQGSIGKLALGIKVTDTAGASLDFTKALIRNLCKIISGLIIYIGYLMAAFTDKKQALHDMIAGTLVVNK